MEDRDIAEAVTSFGVGPERVVVDELDQSVGAFPSSERKDGADPWVPHGVVEVNGPDLVRTGQESGVLVDDMPADLHVEAPGRQQFGRPRHRGATACWPVRRSSGGR